MKKKLIAILFCLAMVAIPASAQFRYGAVVGPTYTNLHFKQDLVTVDAVPGFQAGVLGELMFPGIGFGIDLGLIYNMAGAKVNLGEKPIWQYQGYGNERLMLHQLNIPFHLRFKWTRLGGLEDIVAPFCYGGPDFSLLVGHNDCKAISWAGGDVGVTAGIGAELWHRWQVSGSYTWGLTYSLKTAMLTNYSATCRQWTVRVTYFF